MTSTYPPGAYGQGAYGQGAYGQGAYGQGAAAWWPQPVQRPDPSALRSTRRYHTVEDFIAARSSDWSELGVLLRYLGNKRAADLGADWVYRFGTLYRAVSADLAVVQLRFPRSPVVVSLNELVAEAHNALYAEPRSFWRRLATFLAVGFPRIVRKNAAYVWTVAVLFVLAILAGWLWYALDPDASRDAFGIIGEFNEAEVPLTTTGQGIVDFVAIALNNIRVAFLAFALGILVLGTGFVLFLNGVMVGVFGAHAYDVGRGADFMALVTPHGVVELTVIVLAAAAGIRIGWAVVAPGRRKRSIAVTEAGRDAVRILIGTVPLFILAAFVEGFVTPAGAPIEINIALGWVFGILVWAYLAFSGRLRRPEPSRRSPPASQAGVGLDAQVRVDESE